VRRNRWSRYHRVGAGVADATSTGGPARDVDRGSQPMTDATADAVDLVHCLGYISLRHGQPYRAVILLIVAAQSEPNRPELLRTLCGALIAAGMGGQALDVLAQL